MMKKLILSKGKAMACLILMCLFFTQSCRKENFKLAERQPNGQLIKQETINKWLETNPVAKYISLDWSKAKQAIIQGKNVVRVPTLNIDKINALNKNTMLKENLLASNGAITNTSNTGNNSNYYTQHPPEVFFIQNNGNEKLHSYLLNFVPEDKTKEFGENGLWTGKLYEWNLTGDTLAVQELIKSVIKHKYLLKFGTSDSDKNINSILKSNKLQSIGGLKDKQFSSFFGWLANLLENVIGWVGSLFGFSDYVGGYNEWGYWEGWRIMPWSDGGGSGGGGSTNGGEIVYGSYLSGYGGMPGDGGHYEPYNYNGGLSSNPNVIMADYIINTFSIQNLEQQTFLYNHPEITNTVFAYAEQLGVTTPGDVQFIQWTIAYLRENPSSLEDFKNVYLNTPESLNLYKLDDLTKLQYPRFAKVVNQLKPYLLANPKVINGIVNYTGYTREQVLDLVTPGRGPKLVVTDNMTVYQTGKPDAQYLRWKMDSSGTNPILDSNGNKIKEDRIFINKATVEELENGLLQLNPAVEKKMQGLAFLLAITIFHETVHYGRQWNELNKQGDWTEYGWQFEDNYLGFRVYNDNAGDLVNYNFKLR